MPQAFPLRLAFPVALLLTGLSGAPAAQKQARAQTPPPLSGGVVPGGPAQLVLATDTNPDPNIFETTLTADEAMVDLDGNGFLASALTYNGSVPGPEIRVKVGDKVIVHFTNDLAALDTTIHWHGVEVNSTSDGTAVSQDAVPPGGTYTYSFVALRPGVYWYHPHIRPGNQVFRGLYGAFIVEDSAETTLIGAGVLPDAAHTQTLVLSDVTVAKPVGMNDTVTFPADPSLPWAGGAMFPGNFQPPTPMDLVETPMDDEGYPTGGPALAPGEIPNVMPAPNCTSCRVNEGQHVLVNGVIPGGRAGSPAAPGALDPGTTTLPVLSGEAWRFRVISSSVTRYFRLRATDQNGNLVPLMVIGGEAGLLDAARTDGGMLGMVDTKFDVGEVVLGTADRVDLVVIPVGNPGDVVTIWTRDYSRTGQGYPRLPTVPILHMEITGTAGSPDSLPVGTPLLTDPSVNQPLPDLKPLTITDHLLNPAPFGLDGSADETIRLTRTMQRPSIDGVVGMFEEAPGGFQSVPFQATSRFARVGDLLELRIENLTSAHHPFHQHGFAFQPVRIEDGGGSVLYNFTDNEFMDTYDVLPGLVLVYRTELIDRPQMDGVTPGGAIGRWLLHCHIFHHATLGMITELVVLPRRLRARQPLPTETVILTGVDPGP